MNAIRLGTGTANAFTKIQHVTSTKSVGGNNIMRQYNIHGLSHASSACHSRFNHFHTTTHNTLLSGKKQYIIGSMKRNLFMRSLTSIMMSAVDNDSNKVDDEQTTNDNNNNKRTIDSTWNIGGLKKEVSRLVLRTHKKISKTNTKLANAKTTIEKLLEDDHATMEQLDSCPNVEEIENELVDLRERLVGLNELEDWLSTVKGKGNKEIILDEHIAELAIQLDVDDKPPVRPARGPKKPKGPKVQESTRLPYRRYYTKNKTEIRVGKQAEDNDELSLNPKYRDSKDWWMHASGCPGSHVVIRCHNDLDEEVINDAAALAARQSKCNGVKIKVSLVRCRDVSKPPGAKAGLVRLNGNVQTVTVDMKKATDRLDRLDKTALVN